MSHAGLRRLVGEVERLGSRALPYAELHREITDRLRKVMRIDAACWHGLDPDNVLMTTANPVELLANGFLSPETEPVAARSVLASEYQRDDVNTFASLAGRRLPAAILSESTRGRPERSARYNDFLAPFGLPYEMRTAMVSRGRAWGCVVFHRTGASGDFTAEEAALMGKLSRPIAEALRNTLRFDAARRAGPQAPALLVLDATDGVELATPGTEEVLDLLRHSDPARRTMPAPVIIVAAQTRSAGRDGRQPAPLHVPTADGWVTLYGSLPSGPRDRVAIVLQRTPEAQAARLRLEAFALSPREREVAALIAQGFDTAAISERLFVSPWTVQDHCKAIFEKTGTRTRGELRALVFFEDHLPAIVVRTPLDAGGHLDVVD
ncbi:MAG: helix-turn-helix transcriptional regulator [Bauldia sp.]|nr:helix-turn-helix transcriptional regulator [Bauldia sp.]